MSECKSCGAKVIFAKNEKTGKTMIFDAEPVDDGGTWHIKDGVAYYIASKDYIDEAVGEPLYVSHFAGCPNPRSHRKKG